MHVASSTDRAALVAELDRAATERARLSEMTAVLGRHLSGIARQQLQCDFVAIGNRVQQLSGELLSLERLALPVRIAA